MLRGLAPPGTHCALMTGLEDGEPLFSLRARDKEALGACWAWLKRARRYLSEERRMRAVGDIVALEHWQRDHASLVRDPD